MNGTSIMVSTAGIQSSNPQPLRRGDKEFPLLNVEQIWIIINYSIMKLLWASVAFGTSKRSLFFEVEIFFTILRGFVWMSMVSVRAQSGGSATQMPFLARAWMIPQWFKLWKLGSAYRCDRAMQYSSALARVRTMWGFNRSTSCKKKWKCKQITSKWKQ